MSYKPFDLSGKVALVTGGNGGIGLGMADAIAQSGADVAIWGTNEEKNKRAGDQLRAHGVKVYTRKVDVSDEQQVVDGIGATVKELGRIDAVFANAGVGFGAASFVEMSTELYRKTLAVNLDGVFWTLRETSRHMVERAKAGDAGGSLVGVASLAAIEGAARNEAYAARAGQALGRARRFRRRRGLSHIGRLVLSFGRHVCDRWRLRDLLEFCVARRWQMTSRFLILSRFRTAKAVTTFAENASA